MSVLIFSESYDSSTNSVVQHLNQLNVPYLRINTNFNFDNICSVNIQNEKLEIEFNFKDKIYSINDFSLIWARRGFFNIKEIDLKNKFKHLNIDSVFETHLQSEVHTLIDFLAYEIENTNALCIGNPSNYDINKLIVLKKAVECGLNIPNTFIVKEAKKLEGAFSANDVLVSKPMSNCLNYFSLQKNSLITQGNMTRSLSEIGKEKFSYSLFQNIIEIEFELRIFFILDKYFCSAIIKNKNEPQKRRMMPYKLPKNILDKLMTLMEELNLNTGSIDLLVDSDLNYYFLEVNPCGQIEWLADSAFPNLHYDIASIIKTKHEEQTNTIQRFT